LKLLFQISIYGTKSILTSCASIANLQGGTLSQIGQKRKIPDSDSWCYASPWYRLHFELLDEEIFDYISSNKKIGDALAIHENSVSYAFLTLCPVGQTSKENLACIFTQKTLKSISDIGIDLQIAPASAMPDAPYWKI
jgi:hypothetical protein